MQGDGRYNRNSTAQAAAGDRGVPLLVEAAEAVPFPPGAFASARGPVVLADYGCSEGRNSLMPIGAAVDALRARHGNDLQVLVLHTDLPGNDYSSLFGTLAHDPLTYQRPGVFPVAAGRSYFEQLAPTGTVALGWSSIALHWLSAQPGPLTGIWPHLAPTSEQVAWRSHAAADWAAFLFARGAELVRSPQTNLQLERCELVRLGDPLWDQTRSGEPGAYARAVAAAIRVSFGPSLLAPVPADQREALSARLFDDALAAAISAQPAEPWFDWHLVLLTVTAPTRLAASRS